MKINKKIILKNTSKLLALTTISTAGMFPTNFTSRFYSSTVQAGWFTSPYDKFIKENQIKPLTEILQGILLANETNQDPKDNSKVWSWFKKPNVWRWLQPENEKQDNEEILQALQTQFDREIGKLAQEHPHITKNFEKIIQETTTTDVLTAYLNYVFSFRGHTLESADGEDLDFVNSIEFTTLNEQLSTIRETEGVGTVMLSLQSLVNAFSTKRFLVSMTAKGQKNRAVDFAGGWAAVFESRKWINRKSLQWHQSCFRRSQRSN